MKMLMLHTCCCQCQAVESTFPNEPHPFSYGEILQREVLWPLEHEEEEIEYRPEPVELVLSDVGSSTGVYVKGVSSLDMQG